jgi:hypothetical protein
VLIPIELVEDFAGELSGRADAVLGRLRQGEPLGLALVHEDVEVESRRLLLGHFVSDELADGLDRHYLHAAAGDDESAFMAELAVEEVLATTSKIRSRAQKIGAFAIVPFILMVVVHGFNHNVPLFLASFAGFAAAMPAIWSIPKMRGLALREAKLEYAEYYFLFPLFLSITLLTSSGFFDAMQGLIHSGIEVLGHAHVAFAQFLGATFLSAILDNNIVADFASRGLHGLDLTVLRYFAMAQISGYALGGCWTHIGCAQSVVAFAFIQRDVDAGYTPIQWIKEMTPVIFHVLILMAILIYAESAVLKLF